MVPNNAATVTAAVIVTFGLITASAAAGTAIHAGDRNAGRAHPHATLGHTHRDARHDVVRHAGYAIDHAPSHLDRDYVFVPGRGILGEDCDMPTSTCPNEMRDTQ